MSNTLQTLTIAFKAMREGNEQFKSTLLKNDPNGELRTTKDGLLVAAGIETALACFYGIVGNESTTQPSGPQESCMNCSRSDCSYYQQHGKACQDWK